MQHCGQLYEETGPVIEFEIPSLTSYLGGRLGSVMVDVSAVMRPFMQFIHA